MWWLEFLSVAMFAMGWWPCGGCDSSPGTNDGCPTNCDTDTTPDELTVVIGGTAISNGNGTTPCTDGECAGVIGTYVIDNAGGACYPVASGGTWYDLDGGVCAASTTTISAGFIGPPPSRDLQARLTLAEPTAPFTSRYVYFNNVAIGVLDCCDYLTPARSVTWTSEGISGCDMTGLTATVECT